MVRRLQQRWSAPSSEARDPATSSVSATTAQRRGSQRSFRDEATQLALNETRLRRLTTIRFVISFEVAPVIQSSRSPKSTAPISALFPNTPEVGAIILHQFFLKCTRRSAVICASTPKSQLRSAQAARKRQRCPPV